MPRDHFYRPSGATLIPGLACVLEACPPGSSRKLAKRRSILMHASKKVYGGLYITEIDQSCSTFLVRAFPGVFDSVSDEREPCCIAVKDHPWCVLGKRRE